MTVYLAKPAASAHSALEQSGSSVWIDLCPYEPDRRGLWHSIPNRLTGRSIEGGMRLRQADCTWRSLVVSEPYVDVFKRGDESRDKCEC